MMYTSKLTIGVNVNGCSVLQHEISFSLIYFFVQIC